jgi:hypothetical protein
MLLYCQELRKLENIFDGLKYLHILQGRNEIVNELAKHGSSWAMFPTRVFLYELHGASISKALAKASKAAESSQETPPSTETIPESPELMEIHSDWRTPFMIYLRIGGLPKDKDEHEQLHRWVGLYTLLNAELFWRSINDTLMKCVTAHEGCAIL